MKRGIGMNRSKIITRIAIYTTVSMIIIFLLNFISLKDNTGKHLSFFVISSICVLIIYSILCSVIVIKSAILEKKDEQKNTQRNISNLSYREFKNVHINSTNLISELISKDEINCKAKLKENVEVVCKIKTDTEVILPIDRFLEFFTFDD